MPTVSHQIKKNGFKALNMTPNKIGPFLAPIPTQAFCLLTLPFVMLIIWVKAKTTTAIPPTMLIIFRFSLFAKTCENVNKLNASAMTNGNSTIVCPNAILIPAVTPCLLP
jgi:hypothetical protein